MRKGPCGFDVLRIEKVGNSGNTERILQYVLKRSNPRIHFKTTYGLLEFPMASTFVHSTQEGLRGHAYKFHQQRCCTHRRQFAFTIRTVSFWIKLPTKIVDASSVKSFKALPVPRSIHLTHLQSQSIPSAHIDPRKNSHRNDPSHITLPLHLVVCSSLYCFVDQKK